jgi:hypothetical protein
MSKSFEDYAAEAARAPFSFPLPGGESVSIPQPSLEAEQAAIAAANATGQLIDGVLTYVDEEDGQLIRDAWGKIPSIAMQAVIADMRKCFGTKNSAASPPS